MIVSEPEANADPVPVGDGTTVEKRVCSCCKPDAKTRTRYFIRDEGGTLVCMALSWESLCKARGWDSPPQ